MSAQAFNVWKIEMIVMQDSRRMFTKMTAALLLIASHSTDIAHPVEKKVALTSDPCAAPHTPHNGVPQRRLCLEPLPGPCW